MTRRTCRTLVQSHLHTLVHIYLCIIFWREERKVVGKKNQSEGEREPVRCPHTSCQFSMPSCFQVSYLPTKRNTNTQLISMWFAESWGCFQTTFSADRRLLSRSLVCGLSNVCQAFATSNVCGNILSSFFPPRPPRLLSSTLNTVFVASLFRVLFAVRFAFCVCDKVHI